MLFAPIRLAIRLVSLVVTGAAVYLIVSGVQVVTASHLATNPSDVAPASAIVLVDGSTTSGSSSVDFDARLEWATRLFAAGRAPKVVVAESGPVGARGFASVARALRAGGVPNSALVEVTSPGLVRAFSATEKRLGYHARVIVVTDAIDALWTEGAASGTGLRVEISSPPGSQKIVFSEIDQLWKQASGVAVGRVIGYPNTTWAAG